MVKAIECITSNGSFLIVSIYPTDNKEDLSLDQVIELCLQIPNTVAGISASNTSERDWDHNNTKLQNIYDYLSDVLVSVISSLIIMRRSIESI